MGLTGREPYRVPGREPYRVLGRGGFGADHRWPVTLQYGDLELAPMQSRYQADWERVRRENLTWLRPWEATLPPGARPGPASYGGVAPRARPAGQGGSDAALADPAAAGGPAGARRSW